MAGKELAEKILNQITALGIAERDIYWSDSTNGETFPDGSIADYFTIIDGAHWAGIPGIIVEHAFISNPGDAAFMGNEENLRALGAADATGIAEQYGLKKVGCTLSAEVVDGGLSIASAFGGSYPDNVAFMVVNPVGVTSWVQAYESETGLWGRSSRWVIATVSIMLRFTQQ